ncbi:MAG: farnesyl-diphosphate synthase [Paracoccaceae bacterium]|nr:MAG: farnesyl-diphosphate synthase [Paracoccaceae bacterium]
MQQPEFRRTLAEAASRVEACLDALLPRPAGAEARIAAAMRHAALGPGKRLRAFLTIAAAALFGVPEPRALRAAAAVECLHAYSLVHDDLPCMDDDDLRRGLPTVHVAWDEATAVLAGDALHSLAFAILADPATHPDGAVRAELCRALADAAGVGGMVGGQAIDIAAACAPQPLDLAAITRLQQLKTGALIRFAAEAGAILAAAPAGARAALGAYAGAMGLAFQIHDDILDVTGEESVAGKRLAKDAAAGKATFVGLLGLDGARAHAAALVDEAIAALAGFGPAADPLRAAARFAIARSA